MQWEYYEAMFEFQFFIADDSGTNDLFRVTQIHQFYASRSTSRLGGGGVPFFLCFIELFIRNLSVVLRSISVSV